jgi:glycine/D-amino acid oxidase-like deaminating enzyme
LRLLTALHDAIIHWGGRLRGGCLVHSVRTNGTGFDVDLGSAVISTDRVVLAAGLGSKRIARDLGLELPIRPQRGQLLVTERIEPCIPLPLHSVRQTREGTVMIGATHEEAGFDSSTTADAGAALSARAIRCFPGLGQVSLVRQWAGLRVMTPDSYPVYAESESQPGAFVATCHSGVTLAAMHAGPLAGALLAEAKPAFFDQFSPGRFDVSQAA